jgi:hypothetical protein
MPGRYHDHHQAKAGCPVPAQRRLVPGSTLGPDEARQVAVEKVEAGEEITVAAKEIVAEAKNKRRPRRQKPVPTNELALRLVRSLERYKKRWIVRTCPAPATVPRGAGEAGTGW